MPARVNVNGEIVLPGEAKVSVFDRGFLYGDSVYEVVRTYGLACFELEAHLRRLRASADRIGLRLPWADSRFAAEIERTLAASKGDDPSGVDAAPWNVSERHARVLVTRGSGEMGLDPSLAADPMVVVIVVPLSGPARSCYSDGVKVWPVREAGGLRRGGDPSAKTGEHVFHVLAMREARKQSAHEALLVDGVGNVTEGASSNVFAVCDRELVTPPLVAGILEGVTRGVVLELCRGLGIRVRQGPLPLAVLETAEEAFLTSTVREVLPISRVGDRAVGAGRPGEVTQRLHAAFRQRADLLARRTRS